MNVVPPTSAPFSIALGEVEEPHRAQRVFLGCAEVNLDSLGLLRADLDLDLVPPIWPDGRFDRNLLERALRRSAGERPSCEDELAAAGEPGALPGLERQRTRPKELLAELRHEELKHLGRDLPRALAALASPDEVNEGERQEMLANHGGELGPTGALRQLEDAELRPGAHIRRSGSH